VKTKPISQLLEDPGACPKELTRPPELAQNVIVKPAEEPGDWTYWAGAVLVVATLAIILWSVLPSVWQQRDWLLPIGLEIAKGLAWLMGVGLVVWAAVSVLGAIATGLENCVYSGVSRALKDAAREREEARVAQLLEEEPSSAGGVGRPSPVTRNFHDS
jgi:hypothetical protein